ncbi:hypothetical protein C8R47DRAFT_479101 [Mycena vitilis]|nr:hypothetical protein C8R47DRAFT_479101 [Mycena vitilis]
MFPKSHIRLGAAEAAYGEELAPSGRKVCSLMVVRDVKHRWNYTGAMITRALMLRKAIDKWFFDWEELRPLLLIAKEWDMLKRLGGILEIFSKVTKQMSRAKAPTLPWVLPMYEHILKELTAHRDDFTLLSPLRTAASAGLEKLNQYSDKAKGCQLMSIQCCGDHAASLPAGYPGSKKYQQRLGARRQSESLVRVRIRHVVRTRRLMNVGKHVAPPHNQRRLRVSSTIHV